MSRKGDYWDNAVVAETSFGNLKMELAYEADFVTHEHARATPFEYLKVVYNRQQRQSSLGYLDPVDFELATLPGKLAA
jgi:transposase InsO family protein